MSRRRSDIIDIKTGKVYLNESDAAKDLGISRYYVRKTLNERIPVLGDIMLAYNNYGMDRNNLEHIYLNNLVENKLKEKEK